MGKSNIDMSAIHFFVSFHRMRRDHVELDFWLVVNEQAVKRRENRTDNAVKNKDGQRQTGAAGKHCLGFTIKQVPALGYCDKIFSGRCKSNRFYPFSPLEQGGFHLLFKNSDALADSCLR